MTPRHPLIEQLLKTRNADVTSSLSLQQLLPASDLKDLEKAVDRLEQALEQHEKIVIVGDFDADGATSTALMVLALKEMGGRVAYVVPDRFRYGYGLTPEIVDLAYTLEKPDLIITVDNGISSHAGVEQAKRLGIEIVITDHHLTSRTPPAAYAIVNPNQPECSFSSKALAGVGVAFYLLAALSTRLVQKGQPPVRVTQYLDLVALGTIADVAVLDHNNRILVNEGLKRISQGACRPGISALLHISGKSTGEVVRADDLAFLVGPRINAAGRLESMTLGIETLLCDDPAEAYQKALALDSLNKERRRIELDMKANALKLVDGFDLPAPLTSITKHKGIVLYEPSWHQGVIGIVAGRLKEQFYCPAFIFAPNEAGSEWLKGSARSITGIHIRDLIERVADKYPDLISHFGGHAMAAGLTLHRDHFDSFRDAVLEELSQHHDTVFQPVIWSDGELEPKWHQIDVVRAINAAGPWGHGFPYPVFEREFIVVDKKELKEKHVRLKLQLKDDFITFDAIAFNYTQWLSEDDIQPGKPLKVHYQLEENIFQGQSRLQLNVRHLQAV